MEEVLGIKIEGGWSKSLFYKVLGACAFAHHFSQIRLYGERPRLGAPQNTIYRYNRGEIVVFGEYRQIKNLAIFGF